MKVEDIRDLKVGNQKDQKIFLDAKFKLQLVYIEQVTLPEVHLLTAPP